MNFDVFLESLPKIKNIPLPAEASQFKMSPPFRNDLIERYREAMKSAKQAGVVALFFPDATYRTKLALILRKTYSGVHSAQIGFPGGKIEPGDANLEMAAVRETYEEIGVSAHQFTIVRQLTQVYIPPSNFHVQPYIGICEKTPTFVKQDDEVEEIVDVFLDDLLDDSNVNNRKVETSLNTKIEVPAFLLNGHIVWGATAMMLSEVKDLLKQSCL